MITVNQTESRTLTDLVRHHISRSQDPQRWHPYSIRVQAGRLSSAHPYAGHDVSLVTAPVPAQVWQLAAQRLAADPDTAEMVSSVLGKGSWSWDADRVERIVLGTIADCLPADAPHPYDAAELFCSCGADDCAGRASWLGMLVRRLNYGGDPLMWARFLGMPANFADLLLVPPFPDALEPLLGFSPSAAAAAFFGDRPLPVVRPLPAANVDVLAVLGPAPKDLGSEKFSVTLGAVYDQLAELFRPTIESEPEALTSVRDAASEAGFEVQDPGEVGRSAAAAAPAVIRAWGRRNGFAVGGRGVLARSLREAYAAAHEVQAAS